MLPFVPPGHSTKPKLEVYYDQAAAAVGDWTKLHEPATSVDASSEAGPEFDGPIEITAPDATVVGTLATIPPVFLDAAGLIREQCSAGRLETGGSLVVQGRGDFPRRRTVCYREQCRVRRQESGTSSVMRGRWSLTRSFASSWSAASRPVPTSSSRPRPSTLIAAFVTTTCTTLGGLDTSRSRIG